MLAAAAHCILRASAASASASSAARPVALLWQPLLQHQHPHQLPLPLQLLLRGHAGDVGDRGEGTTAVSEPGATSPRSSGLRDGGAGPQQQDVKFDPRDGTAFSRNDMPSRNSGEVDDDGYWGGGGGEATTDTARIRQEIESPAHSYDSGFLAGMHRPGDMTVRELDEQGREVGAVGPDPGAPRGYVWHQQTVEGAMAADNDNHQEGLPAPDGGAGSISRTQPGGTPVAGGLDPLRPDGPAGGRGMSADPGAFARQRLSEMASEAWETLKHGVNNAGQPQVVDELKRVTPETGGGDSGAVLDQPRSTASRPDERTEKLIKEMAERQSANK